MASDDASPTPSWVILGSVPRVLSIMDEASELPAGAADFSLALPAPPRVALLTIASRIFPDRITSRCFPSVLAVDPSAGLLLLHADSDPDPCRAAGPTIIDTSGYPDIDSGCFELSWSPFAAGYFVLDAAAASALPLPVPRTERVAYPGLLGLIASHEGQGYMVAELQPPFVGGDTAILRRFSSQQGEWVRKKVGYPLPGNLLCPNAVVSCFGRLWWVDLSCCLLTCDPFADAPVLTVVKLPLPEGKALESREAWRVLDKYRCVGVSAGKLRFVDMYRNRNSRNGAAQVSVWTLAADHPDSTQWTLEYEATFAEICNDVSYMATGLPRKIPVLALIHPTNPDVIYFFVDDHLLGVDVRARKVVECEAYDLVKPAREDVATRFVHAWQLPPALRSGSAKETINVMGEELQQLNLSDLSERKRLHLLDEK